MCDAGRIRHHLKHNLWRAESLILFVGYQVEGTLGRLLLDKTRSAVKLFDEEICIKAQIEYLHNTSGHADKNGLTKWLNAFKQKPIRVFVNHGSEEACQSFTDYIKKEHGFNAVAPYSGSVYDLITGKPVVETVGRRAEKPKRYKDPRTVKAFRRLMDAADRLVAVARRCEGISNRDLSIFTEQINKISDKWSK